jgi:nucleotide-binding universal stress UspA family protein
LKERRMEARTMFHKIVVAIDGSPASEKALAAAVDLAKHYQAELTAVGVAQLPESAELITELEELRRQTEGHFRRISHAAAEYARSREVALRSAVLRGHVADTILRFVEGEKADLLVVGNHVHTRIRRFFAGSTTDRLADHSPCTVMIVKDGEGEA